MAQLALAVGKITKRNWKIYDMPFLNGIVIIDKCALSPGICIYSVVKGQKSGAVVRIVSTAAIETSAPDTP